jgi:hypothetical protein
METYDITFGINQNATGQNSVFQFGQNSFGSQQYTPQRLTQDDSRIIFSEQFFLSDEDILEIEKKFFEQKKEELLKQYEGKYIALVDGLVIDSDIDFSELAKRVYATYGYRAIFMTRVIRNEKSHKISSPKFKSTKDI